VIVNDSLIFDIGCHNGQDADFYLRKGFNVVAVEANPELCAELRRRFSGHIAEGRFVLIEKAISERAGEVDFFVNLRASIWGTIRADLAKRNQAAGAASKRIVVPSITFSSLIERFGIPHYLKVDIEGADRLCLQGLLPYRDRPQFISIESESRSLRAVWYELNLLRKLGYTKFQIVDQGLIPKQVPPNPAREGAYVECQFELGASGLFGRELQGPWLTYRGALAGYSRIFMRDRLLGLSRRVPIMNQLAARYSSSWYDTHAALPMDR
jgi:FkbM family methyltransferase